jgi:hypothetical protein
VSKRSISDLEAYIVLAFIVAALVGFPLLSLAAYDWDWRCLFAECRVEK